MYENNKCDEKVGGISFFWSYSIERYDDVDFKQEERHGVVAANNLVEAVERICEFYGEENICSILHIEGFDFGVGLFERDDIKDFIWSDKVSCKFINTDQTSKKTEGRR